jgi:hypothetical protein
MQYLIYSTEQTRQAAAPPNPGMMAEMDKLIQDQKKSGVLVTTGGLSSTGKRLQLSGGKFTVTDGPFVEAKELMGGFVVINVKSLDEAIEWAKRFRTIVGDGESEIVQVFGPEDFGQG